MGTKSGLPKIAALIVGSIAVISVATALFLSGQSPKQHYPETASFLHSKFVEGKFIEGFTPGEPDYGFSLDALIQLSIAGSLNKSEAQNFLLESSIDYLYGEDGELKVGLAGKYLFASKVNDSNNKEFVVRVKQDLEQKVKQNQITGANTFDLAWIALGLTAQASTEAAERAAVLLLDLQREDGGFGFDQSEYTTESTADSTSMAIQALELAKNTNKDTEQKMQQAIDAALLFLDNALVDGKHFVAYESEDVNGTALAIMAFKATRGAAPESMHEWLVSKIQADNGLGSPWVENAGDIYATAQGYLALEKLSYLDLIR
jgi:hypothetical protein